ncbi:DUF397 domain-containing protein [Streptomyces sp. NPDC056982]|uniref:DUF397 domain-containing protein n=1 Tax=Streptomyces sp. NPDC056982 TaxID=3345986 RepID=UPI003635CDD9
MTLPSTDWHKSSYSNDLNAACVEVERAEDGVAVRDSKDIARDSFAVGPAPWRRFIRGLASDC